VRSDDAQFRELARTKALPMRRVAYLLCGDWHLAEDLVQSALAKVYRAWPRVQRKDTVDQLFRTVLLRCWLDESRRPSAKRRRAMIGTGVAVAAVLTAGLLVPTLRSSEHPQAVAGAGGSSSAGQPARESQAWEQYLVTHLHAVVPQVGTVTPTTLPPAGTDPALWRNEVVPLVTGNATTVGSVTADIAGAPTVVHIEAFGPHGWTVQPLDRACPMILGLNPANQCTLTRLPDGSSVITVDIADVAIHSPFFRYAEHFRTDSTVVTAASYVHDADNKDRVPLTTAQLQQLATDPTFTSS
jgi:DNA-directed RNA polymerase specialized sigma24 family protein